MRISLEQKEELKQLMLLWLGKHVTSIFFDKCYNFCDFTQNLAQVV